MNIEPQSLEALIGEFSSLPGIGQKTARRLAYHILSRNEGDVERFSANLLNAKKNVHPCPRCYAFTDEDLCPVCKARPDSKCICVVEKSSDIVPFERSGIYKGTYFVLGGVISPLDGIGPDDINIKGLLARIAQHEIDHLNGKVFVDRLTPLRRTLLKRKLNDIFSGKTRTHYRMKYATKKK